MSRLKKIVQEEPNVSFKNISEMLSVELLQSAIEQAKQKKEHATHSAMKTFYDEQITELTVKLQEVKVQLFNVGDLVHHISMKRNGVVTGKKRTELIVKIFDHADEIEMGVHPNNLKLVKKV